MVLTHERQLQWLLLLATILFLIGIVAPMMTITKLIWISHSFSIVSGVYELLVNGQVILFVLLTGFSIVLPILKIGVLFKLLQASQQSEEMALQRYLKLMHDYGRWAMLDVMVVALLIVAVKLGAIATIQVHIGLYIFGLSVLLIMVVTSRVVHLRAE